MNREAETPRYGPASFVAAVVNVLLVNSSAFVLVLWAFWAYQFFFTFFVADFLVSVLCLRRPGPFAQVGRGMLIGWVSVPVSLIVFGLVLVTAKAIGPL